MGLVPELRIFVLDVGKDLIQITRMERVDVILSLRGVRVILGVDDSLDFTAWKKAISSAFFIAPSDGLESA